MVVYGNLTKHNDTYEFAADNQLFSYVAPTARQEVENEKTFSSLTYHYSKSTNSVTDTLNRTFTTVAEGTNYSNWSNKTGTSGAVYAGNSAGDHDTIQLRTNNSNSGVVVTSSSKNAKRITITWNTNTDNARIIWVYAKNTPYDAAADLYDGSKQGTRIATPAYSAREEGTNKSVIEIEGTYSYIGIRSSSGALYIDSIDIEWSTTVFTYSSATIRFGALIKTSLWNSLENVEGYGVMIAYDDDLGGLTLEQWYRDAKTDGNSIDQAIGEVFDIDGDGADEGLLNGKNFPKSLTEKAEGHPDEANATQKEDFGVTGDYYIWYLNKNVTANLKKAYTVVAYIRTTTDLIFLKQTTASAKSVAGEMVTSLGANYADGSLQNLANLA